MTDFNEPNETWTVAIDADTTMLQQQLTDATRLGRQFSNSLVTAFEGIAVKGKGLNEVLRTLALSLSQIVLKAALRPLGDAFGGLLSRLFAGGFAKGGVLQQQMPVPFAAGGVIRSPVAFPLANGQMGLAGERGAEAILPLARGPDGRLGVMAQSGGGVAVTFNVSTPDADSFRRTEAQVAAMVARAVALGQRNL
jgi:phage-related minor tail protein